MSKYIIEIPVDAQYIVINGMREGRCYMQTKGVDDLEELNSDYINEHYGDLQDDAYERGHGIGYQRGFEEGKAVNDKGCEGCKYEGRDLDKLPCMVCSNSRKNCWTAKQTDEEIKVGDEVVDSSGEKGLVVSDGNKCSDTIWLLINGYRVPQSVCKEDYTKTGRHFDIASILKEMQS